MAWVGLLLLNYQGGVMSLTAGDLTGNTCLSGYEKVFPSFFLRLGQGWGVSMTPAEPTALSPRELNQHPPTEEKNPARRFQGDSG